jgi:sec-independent protein translocase protein TatA
MTHIHTFPLGYSIGWPEIVVILVLILILFGGRKLPELAKGLAQGLKSFKHEMNDVKQHVNDAVDSASKESSEPKRMESDESGTKTQSTSAENKNNA